jgi:protein TonB
MGHICRAPSGSLTRVDEEDMSRATKLTRIAWLTLLAGCERNPLPMHTETREAKRTQHQEAGKAGPSERELTLRALEAQWKAQAETKRLAELQAEQADSDRKRAKAEQEKAEAELTLQLEPVIQGIAARTKLEVDPFRKTSFLVGPLSGNGLLRRDNKAARIYLYAMDGAYNDVAADDLGTRFDVVEVQRPWSGDSMVQLSESYLREHTLSGIQMKFWGGASETTISLSPAYVLGFLRAATIALGLQPVGSAHPDAEPQPLERTAPSHPRMSRRANEEGSVLCRLHISKLGAVTHVEVVESSGHPRLDEEAKVLLTGWVFSPRWVGGVALDSTYEHKVTFRLGN